MRRGLEKCLDSMSTPLVADFPLSFLWRLFGGSVLSYLAHYNHTGIAMFMSHGFCQSLPIMEPASANMFSISTDIKLHAGRCKHSQATTAT
jgi:hypothetical protein